MTVLMSKIYHYQLLHSCERLVHSTLIFFIRGKNSLFVVFQDFIRYKRELSYYV